MLPIFNSLRDLSVLSTAARLLLAFAIGAIVGFERTYRNKPAGFRTHILVCLGAAISALTGQYLYLSAGLPADMSRIPAGVVTGLGFIGAGTIIITDKKKVKGLTTAAGMWTTGMIGLAAGSGFYEGAILSLILLLTVETVFNRIRESIQYDPVFRLAVSYYSKTDLDQVLHYCRDCDVTLSNLKITGTNAGSAPVYAAVLLLRSDPGLDRVALIRTICGMDGIISAEEL